MEKIKVVNTDTVCRNRKLRLVTKFMIRNQIRILFIAVLVYQFPLTGPLNIIQSTEADPTPVFRQSYQTTSSISPGTALVMCWQYTGCSTNKLNKIINGNVGKGYRLGLWNCRKGLIIGEKKGQH